MQSIVRAYAPIQKNSLFVRRINGFAEFSNAALLYCYINKIELHQSVS